MRILLATTNHGKIREIRLAMGEPGVELVTLEEAGTDLVPAPDETGTTFAANADLKARYYAAKTGIVTLAEDSGLSIDVLGGRPGVESARYPGETYTEKLTGLHAELAPWPRPWTARYTCAVALVEPTGRSLYASLATVEGEIASAPHGLFGFGYDPIFFFPPYGCTTGEMTDDQKLGVSHRGKAIREFATWLRATIPEWSRT